VLLALLLSLAAGLVGLLAFLVYVWIRYAPIIGRVFEETPVFAPLRVPSEPGGQEVRFPTADGRDLAGTYFPALTGRRVGVVVFCPEYLGDRWSALPYADGLREAGFDLFTFDFRNHGDSQNDPQYQPLQWVSDLELVDLRAALDYLRSRPDRDPAGVGLFGVSRGGGTALLASADDPTIWAVATDGAFPTRGTMLSYILRWAEIYVGSKTVWRRMPNWMFAFVGWAGRVDTQRRLGRRYPSLERAVVRLAPRPWLMIHGEKDAYIGPEIALELFARAGPPKEAWIVPGAKHNRCREADPTCYRERLAEFFQQYAPRRATAAADVGALVATLSPAERPDVAEAIAEAVSR
jgi:alpha-beta hydrolase superfamily lysophospholipase